MTMAHLLIIDDDQKLCRLLEQYLIRCGFSVTLAQNPKEADELFKLMSFDAIVMDVMMPVKNGIEYTHFLRKKGITTPILMLTAMGDVSSRISGLQAGADDYLSKPFDPKELELRLNNLLKRTPASLDEISFGPFVYKGGNDCLIKGDKSIYLTSTERALLKSLVFSKNVFLSREELARQIHTNTVRTIDVQIKRLRQKIEEDPHHPVWIQTLRGKGYRLVVQ